MKKPLIIFMLFCSISSFATEQKFLKSDVKHVTVFLNQAEVHCTSKTNVESGISELVIEGLPAQIDKQSIQVSGKGDFLIMAVKHKLNYLAPFKMSKELLGLEDSLEFYQAEIETIGALKDVLLKEEQMILLNQSIRGEEKGVAPKDLQDMANFFRERLTKIKLDVMKYDKHLKRIAQKSGDFQNQLNLLSSGANKPSSQVLVTVSAKNNTSVSLEISYVVGNAGWHPVYDIRANNTKDPVVLNYKAEVYQNTGLNWDNVKLTLSTSNPSLGGTKPILSNWMLNFYNPQVLYGYKKSSQSSQGAPASPMMSYELSKAKDDIVIEAENISNYMKVLETTLAVNFDIQIPYTVLSNAGSQMVDIKNFDLPATFKYFAVPKLDKDAFLVAQLTGWEDLNMLSGNANIYFEGTYVGESFLDMNNLKDTLDLSLGRDAKILVQRNKIKDHSTEKYVGLNRKEEHAFEIMVRNTKKESVEITIEDQIPLSMNGEIDVVLINAVGAEVNNETGKITWKLKLNPAESKTVSFKYSIKYPKNKSIAGL